jgi:hypothetical protein
MQLSERERLHLILHAIQVEKLYGLVTASDPEDPKQRHVKLVYTKNLADALFPKRRVFDVIRECGALLSVYPQEIDDTWWVTRTLSEEEDEPEMVQFLRSHFEYRVHLESIRPDLMPNKKKQK